MCFFLKSRIFLITQRRLKTLLHPQSLKLLHALGATGSTILLAEGYRMNERLRIFGIPTHREREVILTIVDEAMFSDVFELLGKYATLGKNTRGITVSVDVKSVLGITMLSGEEIADCSRRRGDESMLDETRYDFCLLYTSPSPRD